jgi:hypothetical protein
VFGEELIRTWIDWKRANEVDLVGSARTGRVLPYFDASGCGDDAPQRRHQTCAASRLAAHVRPSTPPHRHEERHVRDEVPAWEDWDGSHLPAHRFVAAEGDRVVGWVA